MTEQNPPYSHRRAVPINFYPPLSADNDIDAHSANRIVNKIPDTGGSPIPTLLYIHIPFCQSICHFCGFYRKQPDTIPGWTSHDLYNQFMKRLLHEMHLWSQTTIGQQAKIESVYIGGGTPSLLPMEHAETLVNNIKQCFNLSPEVEISFEGEVRSLLRSGYVEMLRKSGVHRISFGVQSFNSVVRQKSNLFPDLQLIDDLVCLIRKHGFGLNLDIMLGLPYQTPDIFQSDLRMAVETLNVDHVDLYENILFPNTVHFDRRSEIESEIMTVSERWQMMRHSIDYLEHHGFKQITSEDFVKPGHEYKMKLLNFGNRGGNSQVLALGPTAVGYIGGLAYRNFKLLDYLAHEPGLPICRLHTVSDTELSRRPYVFLPKLLYIDESALKSVPSADILATVEKQLAKGLLERSADSVLSLTNLGKEWIDGVCYDFLLPEERRRLFKVVQ